VEEGPSSVKHEEMMELNRIHGKIPLVGRISLVDSACQYASDIRDKGNW